MSSWALSSGVPAAGPPNISPRNPFMTPSIALRSGSSGGKYDLGLERLGRFGDRLVGFRFFLAICRFPVRVSQVARNDENHDSRGYPGMVTKIRIGKPLGPDLRRRYAHICINVYS